MRKKERRDKGTGSIYEKKIKKSRLYLHNRLIIKKYEKLGRDRKQILGRGQ